MEAIYIPQLLKLPEQTEKIAFLESIEGLDSLTPVRGTLIISHRHNFLEVSTSAETIMTLVCDRCLKNYNYRLSLNTSEIIWLQNPGDSQSLVGEREIALEDLSENLPINGYFEPNTWLYEQLSLNMPVRQLCSKNCQPPEYQEQQEHPSIDSRWSSLASLRQQFPQP